MRHGIAAQLGTALLATVRVGEGRSTTGRRLRLLRGWLLVGVALVAVTSFAAFTGVRDTVETARAQAVPAILGSASAYESLVRANTAAVLALDDGPARLGGSGELAQTQLGVAGQSLAQAGEHNAAGPVSRRELQLVQGLLASYTSWMAQADVRYRSGDESVAAATDVWYAAQLLHGSDGMLAHLSRLRAAQLDALDRQLATGWTHPATVAVWVVPVLVLGAALVAVQLYFRRRFRRTLNPHLLAATGLLLAVATLTALTLPAQAQAQAGAVQLREDVGAWQQRVQSSTAADRRLVAALVTGRCWSIGCGPAVAEFAATPSGSAPPRASAAEHDLTVAGERADSALAAALWPSMLRWLIVLCSAGLAALVVTGFQARINEYRFHLT
ncbi:hypothetical protein [Prauserella muralis]|uniref:Uncharacterized protein n=1 Tax=Prauserella muralis TaxID=588067 RepID=A0A2V4B127_9PSEU|nr:hypothetical protein [Prauserella muralis]PXY22265.1 hypothetical protein BAY60_20515 [Prauserella muralis]TWE27905.1 hypothetical protein FHX69_0554 [Prauserella muralis]